MTNTIYPCIWCNNNAKEVADFYCSVFPETSIVEENPIVVLLEMHGQNLMLVNGGDIFKPNPSISLMYLTMSESEVENIWVQLAKDGNAMMALDKYPFSPKYGWIEDKYGVSWQLYTASDENHIVQKVVPTLMFTGLQNGNAEKAAEFYTSLFPNSEIRGILRYSGNENETEDNVQHGEFKILDYLVMMMDSSLEHKFQFSEGVSLVVNCDNQKEIDKYWNGLISNGGEESQCGWLKDRFGVSWQIVPREIGRWMYQSPKVAEVLFKMKKLDFNILKDASESSE